ncbi:MAG: hypothetical protein PHH97_07110, partial [Candidatus Cloacimonetes bacterium]|nr:hypothetical protein [Candidatus Cloacimonadota bacterium]
MSGIAVTSIVNTESITAFDPVDFYSMEYAAMLSASLSANKKNATESIIDHRKILSIFIFQPHLTS